MRRILITSRIDKLARKYDELLHGSTQFEHGKPYFEPIARIEKLWREFGTKGVVVKERVRTAILKKWNPTTGKS